MKHPSSDRVVRAMTIDGAFRVIAAIATDTANAVGEAQGLAGEAGARLAELLACAVIVRETTQPARRVQLVWRDRRGGTLVADSLPDGSTRGLLNPGKGEQVEAAGEHLLQVNYTLPNGSLHQGVVAIPEGSDLSTALMQYMQTSEQIVAMAAISAASGEGGAAGGAAGGGRVGLVGGYLVQVLPEVTREGLEALTRQLAELPPVGELVAAAGADPRVIIQRVLEGFPFAELADSPIAFGCTCSEARIILGILSLGAEEVASMEAGDPLEVRCDACGTQYVIEPSSIRAMRELRERGEQPS
jgi:molecular chaperone Hsp33